MYIDVGVGVMRAGGGGGLWGFIGGFLKGGFYVDEVIVRMMMK
ncbi:hypothetical protein [Bacillus sp. WP8]|nr:hypothetical protein [Bacillus sp. WP8]